MRFHRTVSGGDETIENLGSMRGNGAASSRVLRGSRFLHSGCSGDVRFFDNLIGSVVYNFWKRLNAQSGETCNGLSRRNLGFWVRRV